MAVVIGVDVARLGGDHCVAVVRDGTRCVFIDKWIGDITQTTNHVRALHYQWGASAIYVDADGLGVGVLDPLRHEAIPAVPFNGSAGSTAYDKTGTLRFRNKRAEAWWAVKELLDPNNPESIEIQKSQHLDELIGDLSCPRYTVTAGAKIQVETKDEIKKRLGRSPDVGDAFVYAFHDLRTAGNYEGNYTPLFETRTLGREARDQLVVATRESEVDAIAESLEFAQRINEQLFGKR